MIIFPKTMLSWNIAKSEDMNEESFSLLLHLEPKLDVVVIGLDDEFHPRDPLITNTREIFKKHDINVEILSTKKASPLFNFLNSESRYIAGALIPPKLRKAEHVLLKNFNKKYQSIEGKEKAVETKAVEEGKSSDSTKLLDEGEKEKLNFKVEIQDEKDDMFYTEESKDYSNDPSIRDKDVRDNLKIRRPWRVKKENWDEVKDPNEKEKEKK